MAGEIVLAALKAILGALDSLRVRAVVVGGLGIQAWGRIRQTKDVDLLIAAPSTEIGALQGAAARHGLTPDPSHAVVRLGEVAVVRLVHRDARSGISVHVDLLLAASEAAARIVDRSRPVELFGQQVRVATCEDLILMKLKAGRPIDRADAIELWRINGPRLDLPYLDGEAARGGLKEELDRAVREAAATP